MEKKDIKRVKRNVGEARIQYEYKYYEPGAAINVAVTDLKIFEKYLEPIKKVK